VPEDGIAHLGGSLAREPTQSGDVDDRGIAGHTDGQDESTAWLGDHAHDAWTDEDYPDHADSDADGVGAPGDSGEDRDEDGSGATSRWWLSPAFFIGALAGMLVIALVWGVTVTGSDGKTGTTRSAAARQQPSAGPTGTAHPSRSRAQRREHRCAGTAAALSAALRAAAPAMDQWEVHVGAMNKLVVGAISLQQANQFWNQTRVGAQQRLASFRAADRRATARSSACPSPDQLGHAPAALRSCARVVARDREVLGAARAAVDTWSHHVHDMEMLRMGHMSPTMATKMWLASWKQGVRELGAYRAAVRAQDSRRCPA